GLLRWRFWGKEPATTNDRTLPHERLHAYQEACNVLDSVREADISDAHLRDQALRAATRCCLNIAEGAGRTGSADKARVYGIARGENLEAAATLRLALRASLCRPEPAQRGMVHARAAYAMLCGLIRRFTRPAGRGR